MLTCAGMLRAHKVRFFFIPRRFVCNRVCLNSVTFGSPESANEQSVACMHLVLGLADKCRPPLTNFTAFVDAIRVKMECEDRAECDVQECEDQHIASRHTLKLHNSSAASCKFNIVFGGTFSVRTIKNTCCPSFFVLLP